MSFDSTRRALSAKMYDPALMRLYKSEIPDTGGWGWVCTRNEAVVARSSCDLDHDHNWTDCVPETIALGES